MTEPTVEQLQRNIAEMLCYRRSVESKRHPRVHGGYPNACEWCIESAVQAVEFFVAAKAAVDDEEFVAVIAEGVHTGLRKGTDARGSRAAWRAIAADDSGWEDAVRFAVSGLTYMGYRLVRER